MPIGWLLYSGSDVLFVTIKTRIISDETGAYTEIPSLLTDAGVLESLLDYFVSRSHDRSLTWMSKVARSVRLFLEYTHRNPAERDSYRLFQNFAQRLYTGTIDRGTGSDPSGLRWLPRSAHDARSIIRHLTDFFDWLGDQRPGVTTINPRYAGGAYDRLCDEAAYQCRRDHAFLGHIWADATPEAAGRRVRAQRTPRADYGEPPAFPDERFMDLIDKGFKVGVRHDYRNILITLLLHGAGFRESEPFHLYFEDVFPDPGNPKQAKVLIHHPSEGIAPGGWRDKSGQSRNSTRAAYLAKEFGLVPRTQLLDSRGAGWKGGMHDGRYYKQAYWFLPEFGEIFLKVWFRYLEEVARLDRPHPFAFINLRREPMGGMYCLSQYNKAHAAACRRIGLQVGKALGTTPHGHRHAYGQRLSKAGVDKMLIRRFMHHASPQSQEVYTQPSNCVIQDEIAAATQRLRSGIGNPKFNVEVLEFSGGQ